MKASSDNPNATYFGLLSSVGTPKSSNSYLSPLTSIVESTVHDFVETQFSGNPKQLLIVLQPS